MDLLFKNYTTIKSPPEDFFENIISVGLQEVGINSSNVEISINLVGEARIRGLNKKYRGKDKVTDVLSFPLLLAPFAQGKRGAMVKGPELVEGQPIDLGDIFICLPFAKSQSKSENISIDDKLARLTVHGFLHLIGHDHERLKKQAEEMFNLENKILSKLRNG